MIQYTECQTSLMSPGHYVLQNIIHLTFITVCINSQGFYVKADHKAQLTSAET